MTAHSKSVDHRLGYRHQKVQRLRRLLRRRAMRESEGVFVIEGAKLLEEALRVGADIESVFVSPTGDIPVLTQVHDLGIRVHYLNEGVIERVSETVTPQPVCAVVSIKRTPLAEILMKTSVLILVDVRDPGNAGTIMRSAEAAGVGAVIFCDECVDPWNPKTLRSSAGSMFHVPIVTGTSQEVLTELHNAGFTLIGTDVAAGTPYDQTDLKRKIALVFGNEASGLSAKNLDVTDELVTIPIVGNAESLNVSMAASVMCFEMARQRRVRD